MTLDEFYAIDPLAMWASLTSEAQASIIRPLLTSVFAEVCQDCDGTDCSPGDRSVATGIVQTCHQQAYDAIEASFYDILGPDDTALHGFNAKMLDDTGKIRVKGVRGPRIVRQTSRYSETVKVGGRDLEIAGFRRISAPGEREVWEAWLQADVDDERMRRHPDQAVGPPLPAFKSVLNGAEPAPVIHHQEIEHARAA